MPLLYASLISKGKYKFKDVPHTCTDEVREILVSIDLGHLTEE